MERLLGLPAEALDYFASPTTYSTANTAAALTGTGFECPPFNQLRRPPPRLHVQPPGDQLRGDGMSRSPELAPRRSPDAESQVP